MKVNRKNLIRSLLKGIETGDPSSVKVVNQEKYIQHNPQTQEGGEGLAVLFMRLSKSNPRVTLVRVFEDGDYVFAHTEYDFANSNIGFEIFRFEGDQTVEHWDNIQRLKEPNQSGHTMVDGPTEVADLDKTEDNRVVVETFINHVLINGQLEQLKKYIDKNNYVEHSPKFGDDIQLLMSSISKQEIAYQKNHRLLAEGNFVLSVSEGYINGGHTSFYDLFRLSSGMIVEHWDTTEKIPAVSEWKNNNGKF